MFTIRWLLWIVEERKKTLEGKTIAKEAYLTFIVFTFAQPIQV